MRGNVVKPTDKLTMVVLLNTTLHPATDEPPLMRIRLNANLFYNKTDYQLHILWSK